MFYLVQYKRDIWRDTSLILLGDIQKHLTTLEKLKARFGHDYRLRRITEETAKTLTANGYLILIAPDKLNDVQDT